MLVLLMLLGVISRSYRSKREGDGSTSSDDELKETNVGRSLLQAMQFKILLARTDDSREFRAENVERTNRVTFRLW